MSAPAPELRVLTVCMGNICRSPSAEAVLRDRLTAAGLGDRVAVDSAGTYGGHAGDPPDPRARAAARRRGYDLDGLRARALEQGDASADLVLVMDRGNLRRARQLLGEHPGLHLYLWDGGRGGAEVPDPYSGDEAGFEHVLDLLEAGADAWVRRIEARLRGGASTRSAPPGGSGT